MRLDELKVTFPDGSVADLETAAKHFADEELKVRIKELEDDLFVANRDCDAQHQRALDAEKKAREGWGTVESYQSRVYDLNKRLEEAESVDAGEIVAQLKRTTDILQERDEELEDLASYNARLQAELENRRLELAELEEAYDEAADDAFTRHKRVEELSSEVAYLREEVAAYARRAGHAEHALGLSGLSGEEIMRRWMAGIHPPVLSEGTTELVQKLEHLAGHDRRVISDPPLRMTDTLQADVGESDGSTQGDYEALLEDYYKASEDAERFDQERHELQQQVFYLRGVRDDQRERIEDLEGLGEILTATEECLEDTEADLENTQNQLSARLAMYRDLEVKQQRDHKMASDLWKMLDNQTAEFAKYREYTQAGFKTLYHERRYGPAAGAPQTEHIISDYLCDIDGQKARCVVYPLPPVPPERRATVPAEDRTVEIEADTTEFRDAMQDAWLAVDRLATVLNKEVEEPYPFSDPAQDLEWPEGAVGMAMYSDGIPTKVIPRPGWEGVPFVVDGLDFSEYYRNKAE